MMRRPFSWNILILFWSLYNTTQLLSISYVSCIVLIQFSPARNGVSFIMPFSVVYLVGLLEEHKKRLSVYLGKPN